MSSLPPLLRDQRKIDAEQLDLLALFHYICAGLALVGIVFLFGHYTLMSTVMNNPAMWKDAKGAPPPTAFFHIFRWFYVAFGVWFAASGVLNLISGLSIKARKRHTLSVVVAALNCLHMPLGTILGVFTLVVLLRDSVRETYVAQARIHWKPDV